MSNSLLEIWVDTQNNALLSGWESQGSAILPTLKQGDSVQVEIHLVRTSKGGSYMEEVELTNENTVKIAIGRNEQSPTAGYFVFTYNGDSVQVPTISTTFTVAQLNTLINEMPSIIADGGVVVSIVNRFTYRIVFNTFGAKNEIVCNPSNLRPTSTIWVKKIVTGSSTVKEIQHIKPKVIPFAYSDEFSTTPAPSIIKSTPSSAITRFSIEPQPKYGSFSISNGTKTTPSLSINSSSDEVLTALIDCGISDPLEPPIGNVYSVTKVGPFDWDINRISGTQETLTASDIGLIGFKSLTGIMSLNNEEVEDFLAGTASSVAMLEIEVSDETSTHTVYQGSVTVVNDLIDAQTYQPSQLPVILSDAPHNGLQYARKDGSWHPVMLDGNNIPEYNNGTTYTVGNQVYFQGKLYRMIIAVGAAGYNPVAHPSYWESLSGSTVDLSPYATISYVTGNFASLSHNHSLFSLGGWGSGELPASGNLLRIYSPNDSSVSVVARDSERRKLKSSGISSIISESNTIVSTNGGFGMLNWNMTTIITLSFASNILRLHGGKVNIVTASGNSSNHSWFLGSQTGNPTSSSASDRITQGYFEKFGDDLRIDLNPSDFNSFGINSQSGSYTADGVIFSWQSQANVIDYVPPDGYTYPSFITEGGVYPVPTGLEYTGFDFFDEEYVRNSYIEPVMRGGVLGEFTQELLGNGVFSYPYNSNISKYSLVFDQNENDWVLNSALNRFENIENNIAKLNTFNTFTNNNLFNNKIFVTQRADSAGIQFLNLNTYPTGALASVGDLWLTEFNLQYKDFGGTVRTCVLSSGSNTFTSPQVFNNQSNQTLPAVRINNLATSATAHSFVVEDNTNPDPTSFIVNNDGVVGIRVNPASWTPAAGVVLDVYGKAVLNPSNINTPSLNLGATASASSPTGAINGDIWITNVASPKLAYRTGGVNYYPAVANQFNTFTAGIAITGASASSPQLAVTQTGQGVAVQITTQIGSGHALVVEDITSPDTSAMVVNSVGSVGVGVDPATWTPTNKVEVVGAIKADSITFNGTEQFKVTAVTTHASGNHSDTHDLFISYNGSTYKIPMMFVSTP